MGVSGFFEGYPPRGVFGRISFGLFGLRWVYVCKILTIKGLRPNYSCQRSYVHFLLCYQSKPRRFPPRLSSITGLIVRDWVERIGNGFLLCLPGVGSVGDLTWVLDRIDIFFRHSSALRGRRPLRGGCTGFAQGLPLVGWKISTRRGYTCHEVTAQWDRPSGQSGE